MPTLKVKRICRSPGCDRSTYERYCDLHPDGPPRKKDFRPSASVRGYDRRWQKERAFFLSKNPLCWECGKNGIVAPAVLVDHIVPHRGDMTLFWQISNWQPLCRRCHQIKTGEERAERGAK